MAAYDYRCRTCDSRFEVRRPVDAPAVPVACPQGHPEVSRIWSAVSVTGRAATGAAGVPAPSGGCCGGGCGCH